MFPGLMRASGRYRQRSGFGRSPGISADGIRPLRSIPAQGSNGSYEPSRSVATSAAAATPPPPAATPPNANNRAASSALRGDRSRIGRGRIRRQCFRVGLLSRCSSTIAINRAFDCQHKAPRACEIPTPIASRAPGRQPRGETGVDSTGNWDWRGFDNEGS